MSSESHEPINHHSQLGVWDAVSIIVGIVIGTTIYRVPWLIFNNTSDPMWGLLVWVIGGLVAMIGAFCYAELATTYPKSGGDYFYLTKAFGPATGFLFGWAQLAVVLPASIGVMAYVFAEFFLETFIPSDEILYFELPVGQDTYVLDPNFAITTMVVVVFTFLNALGVVLGKTVQNLLTFAKVVGLAGIIIAGFCWPTPGAWDYVPRTAAPGSTVPYIGTLALILVMYAYGGWNDAAFVAAEVRDPRRNIPRALFIGVGVIMLVYVLVNAAYINGLGWSSVSEFNDKSVPTRLIEQTPLKDYGGKAMAILVMISALGAVNGLMFTGARVYATLGADHGLFGWMGRWRPGRGAPVVALLLQGLLTVFIVAALTTREGHARVNEGLTLLNTEVIAKASEAVQRVNADYEIPQIVFDREWRPRAGFENLVDRTAPVFWLFFLMTGFSLFVLRERFKNTVRPYSVPFYPLVPLIFCNSCAWMLYQAVKYVEWHALFAFVVVLLGLPLYWVSRLISGVPDDDDGPIDIGLGLTPPPQPPARNPWR